MNSTEPHEKQRNNFGSCITTTTTTTIRTRTTPIIIWLHDTLRESLPFIFQAHPAEPDTILDISFRVNSEAIIFS